MGNGAGRTIAIGDVHGCAKALEAVLADIDPQPQDLIVPLGDYVDRGPDSRGVIEQLLELQHRCRLYPLMGNHEQMMLAARNSPRYEGFWTACGGQETLDSYGGWEQVPDTHWRFLSNCAMYLETDDYLFIHANYEPDSAVGRQAEMTLLWEHLSAEPPRPHCSGKTVILGHTPQPGGQVRDMGHALCIDTYCFGDGCLTALEVHSRELWQADKNGQRWFGGSPIG